MNSINYDDGRRSPTEIYGHLTYSDEFGLSKKFSWSFVRGKNALDKSDGRALQKPWMSELSSLGMRWKKQAIDWIRHFAMTMAFKLFVRGRKSSFLGANAQIFKKVMKPLLLNTFL